MRILLRAVAVVLVLIALFLIGAVINAFASEEGARVGVCVLYVAIAAVSLFGAKLLWSRPASGARPAV